MNDPTENLAHRVFKTLPWGLQTVKTDGWPLLLNTHMWNADDAADVPAGYAYFVVVPDSQGVPEVGILLPDPPNPYTDLPHLVRPATL